MAAPISDDHPRYHNVDPDTSIHAANQLTSGVTDQASLLAVHARQAQTLANRYIGLADYESGQLADIDHWNARKRCSELRAQGYLRFTEERRTRPDSNRSNAVSILTAAGAQAYLQLHSTAPSGWLAILIRRERDNEQGELW